MATICIIEDDVVLRNELGHLLDLQGYTWTSCPDFPTAGSWIIAQAEAGLADCVVLDLKLPGTDGHSICREIRRSSNVPILVLTSSETEFDEVMAMNLEADDYVVKPYRPAVLLARLQALLRRGSLSESTLPRRTISYGGVSLNLAAGTAEHNGAAVSLTRNELIILDILMSNPGVIVTRQELMCELWDTDSFIDDNTLTVNVNRVRKALSQIGVSQDFLTTKRGQGYTV